MIKKILFICTGNSARSIMAEAIMNKLGKGEYAAYSAGADPAKNINPLTVIILKKYNHKTDNLKPKVIDDFLNEDIDTVITVCDDAQKKCPVWPLRTRTLHWSIDDPSTSKGSRSERIEKFDKTYKQIKRMITDYLSSI